MLLSVRQRIVLLQLIPPQSGNLTTLRIVRKLREDLSFTEEEHKKFDMRPEDDGVAWDAELAEPKEVEIGEVAHGIIVDNLKMMNQREVLPEDCLDIIHLFPEVEEEAKDGNRKVEGG